GKEKQNEELRKKVDSGLAKILNDEQKKTLQEMRERMGRGPGVVMVGPGGQMRFGMGSLFARGILQRANTKKDGKVTLEQLLTAADAVFKEADKNKDGNLDEAEVSAAIQSFMPMMGGPGFVGGGREPTKPGPRVTPAEVATYPNASLYDTSILRTLFLEFENKDWEEELADFHGTDVEVPCTVVVDGKKCTNVGVHFRGMSSYMGVGPGSRRSLNLSFDLVDTKQRLYGYKTMNLLNSHDDPSFMHTVLFSHIARQYIPAPQSN